MLDNVLPVTGLSSRVIVASTPSEGNAVMKALQEANMSTEVGLVVLDILALYTQTFKVSPTAWISLSSGFTNCLVSAKK